MGTAGSAPDATQRRVRGVFSSLEEPHAPLTTSEVADRVEYSEQVVRETLETLCDKRELRTRLVADRLRVWWVTEDSIPERESETEAFEAFVSAVEDYAIFTLDEEGVVSTWNEGAERIKGYREGEIVGEHFSTFYPEGDDEAGVPERNLKAARTEGRTEDEGWRIRKDGSRFWAHVTITAIRNDDGSLRGFTKVTRDMTEQREYEQQLREERDFTKQILETVPVSVFVTTADGEIVRANDRVFDRLGVDESNFTELDVESWEIYDEVGDPIPADEWPWKRIVGTGEPIHHFECQIDLPEIGRRWFSINAAPLDGDRSEEDRIVFAVDDVTKRKERERQRREQTLAKYEAIVETINDGIYVKDEAGYFTMVNDAYAELTGYEKEELIGAHASLVVDETTIQEAKQRRESGDGGSGDPTMEATIETATGDRIPTEGTFASIRSADGDTEQVGVVRDISERKEYERKIEKSERRYRTLVDNFPDGIVALFDEDLEYITAGGELIDDLGIRRDEAIGQSIYDRYPDELVAEVEPYFHAALEGEESSFEVEYLDRDLLAYTLPIESTDEDSTGMLVIQDITERREYERKLEASNERLEQFAYAASHDLQEPLRMVSSYLRLIEDRYGETLDADGREFLEFAVDGADRMRNMIDGLLQYSRVDTRGNPIESVDLNCVLEDVREDLQVRIEESDADIGIEPLPTVEGDADQLRQVFQNLLENAIDYSGDEPPKIRVSAEERTDTWAISVRDEGIGIDLEDTDRIFEVFQSLQGPTEHSGTGIGLAICERIVERHGGDIWVESTPGDGSTFTFTLPTKEEP